MKILPVSSKNVQSFQGMWGEKHPNADKLKYYPYKGESEEQIANNTSKHKGLVAIMAALPFTAMEFLKYTKNRLAITKQKIIEKHIVNKGLSTVIK